MNRKKVSYIFAFFIIILVSVGLWVLAWVLFQPFKYLFSVFVLPPLFGVLAGIVLPVVSSRFSDGR